MGIAEDTAYTPASQLAELVAAGEVTARELVDAAIERAEATGVALDAVIHSRYDTARAEADAGPRGPMGGVPFLLKDLAAERAGEPLTEGMVAAQQAGYRSKVTSYVVQSWLDAGAVQIAKSVPAEMGMSADCEPSAHPPVHNPWNIEHSPHGSSGGSAAAVAAGVVPLAHANDAGGSIRAPASACGLVGLKPSRGRVATGPGYGDVAGGIAVEGCVSRTVRDTAIVLDATAGYRPGAPYVAPHRPAAYTAEVDAGQRDPEPLRVGVWDASPAGELDPACVAAVESAAALLGDLGHHVEPSHPAVLRELGMDGLGLAQYGALGAWALADWEHRLDAPVDLDTLGGSVAFGVEMGRDVTAEAFLTSRQRCQEAAVSIEEWHADHDLLVTATMPDPPARIGEVDTLRALSVTCAANLTGQPAISLPLFWSDDGLPIGIQLTAAYGRENLLLRVAAQLEAARPWADRRPPVHAA